MEMKALTEWVPIQITLTTEEEITQLYAVLNYSSIFDIINSGVCDWGELCRFLDDHRGDCTKWHNKLLEKLK